jgi:hypothetical protein
MFDGKNFARLAEVLAAIASELILSINASLPRAPVRGPRLFG